MTQTLELAIETLSSGQGDFADAPEGISPIIWGMLICAERHTSLFMNVNAKLVSCLNVLEGSERDPLVERQRVHLVADWLYRELLGKYPFSEETAQWLMRQTSWASHQLNDSGRIRNAARVLRQAESLPEGLGFSASALEAAAFFLEDHTDRRETRTKGAAHAVTYGVYWSMEDLLQDFADREAVYDSFAELLTALIAVQ